MPINCAQRRQIEQDAITAACGAVRLGACDDAIAQQLRIAAVLAQNDM